MILLVVDVQKGITDERLYAFDTFIDRITRLIDAARENGTEVIYFQHDDGPGTSFSVGDEAFEIAGQVTPEKEEKVYIKTINSCFGNKSFAEHMEQQEDKRLMIIGLQTNFCIDATVKSAFERGYRVIIPEGTNSTFDNEYMNGETTCRYYNQFMWPGRFAECISFDEAIRMITK